MELWRPQLRAKSEPPARSRVSRAEKVRAYSPVAGRAEGADVGTDRARDEAVDATVP